MEEILTRSIAVEDDLGRVFAYKAEWLKENLYDLYTRPNYLSKIPKQSPCILVGGRGTGKTTVLRGLSYQGQYALDEKDATKVSSWSTYGIYLRINTNRVAAFSGDELSENRWEKLFSHYVNLLLCDLTLEFLTWHEEKTNSESVLSIQDYKRFCKSLHLPKAANLNECRLALDTAVIEFEADLNNIAENPPVKLSLLGAPIDILFKSLHGSKSFSGKHFNFLIDEYENLAPYQQKVVNTLIKHASETYTFKVGVRELGWRCKTTLNNDEQLVSPADYQLFNITNELLESNFEQFAQEVCNARLRSIKQLHENIPEDIVEIFPSIDLLSEAIKLGVKSKINNLAKSIDPEKSKMLEFLDDLNPLEQYYVRVFTEETKTPLEDMLQEMMRSDSWRTQYDNYSYSLLFGLKRKKRGIRKYYSGWKTLTLLANGNLRYLIELVDANISTHLAKNHPLTKQISAETQTKSAQKVGRKNLGELEGLSIEGAKLTKLVLGLGRLFGVMAEDPAGHAPEVNQFKLNSSKRTPEADSLLDAGVMHLALVRHTGTKVSGLDTKDYDYSLHPIFSPFFSYSHRKKRKLTLSGGELLGLVENTNASLKTILAKSNRVLPNDSLPDQLELFQQFYQNEQS